LLDLGNIYFTQVRSASGVSTCSNSLHSNSQSEVSPQYSDIQGKMMRHDCVNNIFTCSSPFYNLFTILLVKTFYFGH
jgi:hypothetical protein